MRALTRRGKNKIRVALIILLVFVWLDTMYILKIKNELKTEIANRVEIETRYAKQEEIEKKVRQELEDVNEVVQENKAQIDSNKEEIKSRDQTIETLTKELARLKQEAKKIDKEVSRSIELKDNRVQSGMLSKSGATVESIDDVLKNSNLKGLGKYYIQAEEEYGINAKFLASISILESGWGKSNISNSKNNIFGFQAYDNATHKAKAFSSKGESILHVGKYISENYLTQGGKYYNGTSIEAVNKKYCTSSDWSSKVRSLMNKM